MPDASGRRDINDDDGLIAFASPGSDTTMTVAAPRRRPASSDFDGLDTGPVPGDKRGGAGGDRLAEGAAPLPHRLRELRRQADDASAAKRGRSGRRSVGEARRSPLLLFASVFAGVVVGVAGTLLALGTRPAAPTGAGPWSVSNGVPVGYQRSANGAAAAAARFVGVLGTPHLDDPKSFRAAFRQMAAPGSQTSMADAADRGLEALDQQRERLGVAPGTPITLRMYPLSTRVDAYAPQAATVRVWAVTVLGVDGVLAPRSGWTTYTFSMVWAAGDWKVAQLSTDKLGANPTTDPEDKKLPEQLSADFTPFASFEPDVAAP